MHPCETLMRSQPATVDPKTIKRLIGNATVPSMPEVARAFGISCNTVRQSWRPSGMPGEPGSFSLADIAVWRLKYLQEIGPKIKAGGNVTILRLDAIEKRLAALESQTK